MAKSTKQTRGNFSSRFGVLMAMAGSAVGLGNMWRFPYLVGQYGGAAFIIMYLIFLFFVSLPLMLSEFSLGRNSGLSTVGTFKKLAPKGRWQIVGFMNVLATCIVLSFYCVVGGWSISYLLKSLTFEFTSSATINAGAIFANLISAPGKPMIYTFIFLALTCLIVDLGVKKGIESFTKAMMPMLFVLVIIVAIRSVTLNGAGAGLEYLFKPDFSKLSSDALLAALGQSFFSLSLGYGTILTYGSYVSKDENIVKCSIFTGLSDTLFAILAGVAIMPAVFAFGINPTEGPSLVFVTLPEIFHSLPLGGIIAILFFFTLFMAAITSSISLLEVAVAYFVDEHKFNRKKVVGVLFLVFLFFTALCSLSHGALADFKIFGKTIFDLFDYVSANVLMTLGGLFIVLFTGWIWGKKKFVAEISNKGTLKLPNWFVNIVFFLIKYVAPIAILTVFITGILPK
ncbi:MAG: sodium-dependent transporter [Bacteroidales bacterium]|nr:sodium-dependent transporter [Bacteroidales bacterium]